jgi:hypothetical protein
MIVLIKKAGNDTVKLGIAPRLIISIISCLVDHDRPKSKVNADFTISKYCKYQTRSSPNSCRSSTICLAVACLPSMINVGSGETTLNKTKIIKQTPSKIGIV